MKKRVMSIAAMVILLTAFVFGFVSAARADGVDQKIQALEAELNNLKAEQSKTQAEQIELKKEATAAAAALPNFTYRPGDGLWIEAADRAWSLNVTYELELASYNVLHGNPHLGAAHGDIFWRRNRPYLRMCLDDCFYDFTIGWDMDTGDMVNPLVTVATGAGCHGVTASSTAITGCTTTTVRPNKAALQTQSFKIHFEKINPYLPRFEIGDNIGSYANSVGFPGYKTGNQNVSADEQITDMLSDSDASELGRRAIALAWIQIPVGPGDFTFNAEYKPGASVGDVNTGTINTATTDRKQLQTVLQLRPFSRSKNPWLERLAYGTGVQTDSIDNKDTGNRGLSLTTFEREGRQTVFTTGSNIGRGAHTRYEQALAWGFGPYWLLVEHGLSNYDSGKGSRTSNIANDCCLGVKGYYWGVTHDFWLWGPKGPLTGERGTAGSWMLGFGFKKATAECDRRASATGGCGGNAGSEGVGMTNNTLTARTWGLFYTIWRGARVGINYNWYTAANTPTSVQTATGCSSKRTAVDVGKSCDIHAIDLILHTNF